MGDGYVHRLIQGYGGDKVVEYQAGAGNMDEKMESVTLEVLAMFRYVVCIFLRGDLQTT